MRPYCETETETKNCYETETENVETEISLVNSELRVNEK